MMSLTATRDWSGCATWWPAGSSQRPNRFPRQLGAARQASRPELKALRRQLAALMACAALIAGHPVSASRAEQLVPPGNWSVSESQALAPPMVASDLRPALLAVHCEGGKPRSYLRHPRLWELPQIEDQNSQSPWHGTVRVLVRFGLDLRRTEYHGAQSYWKRCASPGCLVGAPVRNDAIIRQIESNWSVFIRLEFDGEPPVDVMASLQGSAAAIREVCAHGTRPKPLKSATEDAESRNGRRFPGQGGNHRPASQGTQ